MRWVDRTRLPCAAIAVALAGCALPSPEAPPLAGLDVPKQWAQPVPAGAGSLSSWWRAFGDPLLTELVEAAHQANTSIAIAGANLRQARAAREEAAATLWPGASASAIAQRSRSPVAGGQNRFEAGLDASWELDVFGGNRHALAAQEALTRASSASLGATQVSIAAEVALAYLQLRGAQVRTAVARENLASQEETLQISRWRQQAGLASSLEVEQAVSAVEQTRAQVPALESAAARAAHALAVLTGRPPSAILHKLAAGGALPRPTAGLAVAIPAETLRQRPDILAAEEQLKAAAERVGQADAQRLPSVTMGASLAWSGVTLGSLGGASAARSLLASVAQPLFDAGRLDARLAARQAEFDAAQASYRANILAALQEVEDALIGIASTRERLAALQRSLEAARNAALLATQRHASGLIDFQTVLETQRTLLNVQDGVASAEADLAAGHVRLYKALGGGWRPAAREIAS